MNSFVRMACLYLKFDQVYTVNGLHVSRALGVIRRYCNQLWIFCGDYDFRVFDRHPRGKRDIVEDQSKV